MRVGFIGLGNMGIGMAGNLLAKGADLTVQNRTRAKADRLAAQGARVADTPGELAAGADIVLTCLADVQTTRDILLGPDGVLSRARPGQIIVDHATVDLAASRDCAAAAAGRGAYFLDAPISGGPLGARDGTLAIMVGGDRGAFDRALPVLRMMGANVRWMGATGAGTAMKLINQLLVSIHTCAAAEAFCLANAAGVDIQEAADVLAVSWGASRMVERSAPITKERDFENSAAPLRNLVKDIGIIAGLAADLGLAFPLGLAAKEVIEETARMGYGEGDIAATILALEKRSGQPG